MDKEVRNRIEKVKEVTNYLNVWLSDVTNLGNETAFSDNLLRNANEKLNIVINDINEYLKKVNNL